MSPATFAKKVVLVVLDGWGHGPDAYQNAITGAHPPVFERWWRDNPHTLIDASGPAVGLPAGQMGNSEVGHLNLGAGRLVFMELSRVYQAMADGTFATLPCLKPLAGTGRPVHLMGLLSDGGVHSHIDHWLGALDALKALGVKDVWLHPFGDGRDTPPRSMGPFLERLEDHARQIGLGRVVSLMGRYWAMDRDKRWERTERAFRCLVHGEGGRAATAQEALAASYGADVGDEFMEPCRIGDPAQGWVMPGDGVWFMNFRPDRARQLCQALTGQPEVGFDTAGLQVTLATLGMVMPGLTSHVCFMPERPTGTLVEVLTGQGLKVLKIAETEKYAHVTYFFNGGQEVPFEGEDRLLAPSPKVATYDLKPDMSAREVTEKLITAAREKGYDFILVNYANTDMVGHTGDPQAARQAVLAVDECLGQLEKTLVQEMGYTLVVTADHGNAEQMVDPVTGAPHTAHTTNLVPLIVVNGPPGLVLQKEGGVLSQVAATVMTLMGLTPPVAYAGGLIQEGVIPAKAGIQSKRKTKGF